MNTSTIGHYVRDHRFLLLVVCLCMLVGGQTKATEPTSSSDSERVTEHSLDRPQLIRTYSINHARGDHVISVLRSIYPHVEHVRFGFDKRTRMLIVVSVETYQRQISQIISQLDTPAAATESEIREESEKASAQHTRPSVREYLIKHVDGKHVVAVLSSLYRVVNNPKAYARFAFDSRRNVVIVITAEKHLENVARIVSLLDTPIISRHLLFREGVGGYAGTKDVVVVSHYPDANENGETLSNDVGDNEPSHFQQALIRFENIIGDGPDQILPAVRIKRATLTLGVYNRGSGVVAHRILEPWSETSTFASLNSGINHYVDEADDSTNVRRLRRPSSGYLLNQPFHVDLVVMLDVTASLRAWVEKGEPNYGWVLLAPPGGTDSVGMHSSEHGDRFNRPLLTVEYEPARK